MSEKKIYPKCANDEGHHFVTPDGYWLPCCGLSMKQAEYFKSKNTFNVLTGNDFHLTEEFLLWKDHYLSDYSSAPSSCKKKCSRLIRETEFYSSGDDIVDITS